MELADAGDDLWRALAALQRAQGDWLADLAATCPATGQGDAAFAEVFRRWQEQLTRVKLQVHRAEGRLLGFVHSPTAGLVRRDTPPPPTSPSFTVWRDRIEHWFVRIHIDRTYRWLPGLRDEGEEPVRRDLATDLAQLAELVTATSPLLAAIAQERDLRTLEDLAFTRIIAPWRTGGMAALHPTLRWLDEALVDEGEW